MAIPTQTPPPVDAWFEWADCTSYTVGAEEEMMLVHPPGWALAQTNESVLPALPSPLNTRVQGETHGSALEIGSEPHARVAEVEADLHGLRCELTEVLEPMGLRAACAGTHPFAVWHDTVISEGERYARIYGSMRELARREPTFALHVHVGMVDAERAIVALNRMRAHLPLLLALSGNSPFWQGRDTGLASARTPLFQAFPRVGVPRAFDGYDHWVESIDTLVRCGAIPDPSFLWWDVRLQPRFGTVEVRIMDVQSSTAATGALAAFVQCLVLLECEEGWASEGLLALPEAIQENRFLASRDGMAARLLDPDRDEPVAAKELTEELLAACAPYARELGCEAQLDGVRRMAEYPGATWQRDRAAAGGLRGLTADLADAYVDFRA